MAGMQVDQNTWKCGSDRWPGLPSSGGRCARTTVQWSTVRTVGAPRVRLRRVRQRIFSGEVLSIFGQFVRERAKELLTRALACASGAGAKAAFSLTD